MESDRLLILIGTSNPGSTNDGIYVFCLDINPSSQRKEISEVGFVNNISSPGYLALSANQKYLYAVNTMDSEDTYVFSFAFFVGDGNGDVLRFINKQKAGGKEPCYISIAPSGLFLTVANYGSGSISVLPIASDGSIGSSVEEIKFSGDARDILSHTHCVVHSPDNKYLFVEDLGTDKIYRFSVIEKPPFIKNCTQFYLEKGSGPRHLIFSPSFVSHSSVQSSPYCPSLSSSSFSSSSSSSSSFSSSSSATPAVLPGPIFAYLTCELSGAVACFEYTGEGSLEPIQYCASDPAAPEPDYAGVGVAVGGAQSGAGAGADAEDDSDRIVERAGRGRGGRRRRDDRSRPTAAEARKMGGADVHIHPSGRFLYASNRHVASPSSSGASSYASSPSASASLSTPPFFSESVSDSITVFRIHPRSGRLTRIQQIRTGRHPRSFALSANGQDLFVACRDSDAVLIYRVDAHTGRLTFTGAEIAVERPIFVTVVSV